MSSVPSYTSSHMFLVIRDFVFSLNIPIQTSNSQSPLTVICCAFAADTVERTGNICTFSRRYLSKNIPPITDIPEPVSKMIGVQFHLFFLLLMHTDIGRTVNASVDPIS